jgi:hypothetical protein
MKKAAIRATVIFLSLLLLFVSPFLARHPLNLFVLRGQAGGIEAFKITADFNGSEPGVEAIALSAEQKKQGGTLLEQRNPADLEIFSKAFGSYGAVIGMPGTEEGWPDYLGNGVKWIQEGMGQDLFDDLQWTDRVYLAFALKVPPPAPFPAAESASSPALANHPAASAAAEAATPIPDNHAGVVRVEILNGCGITNAADWAARRMKGPGITIVDSGNADNFQYPKTLVRTSGGVPVALEEALGRLGLSQDSIEETSTPNPNADVVVIVGRDFPKLKGRKHERNHH